MNKQSSNLDTMLDAPPNLLMIKAGLKRRSQAFWPWLGSFCPITKNECDRTCNYYYDRSQPFIDNEIVNIGWVAYCKKTKKDLSEHDKLK